MKCYFCDKDATGLTSACYRHYRQLKKELGTLRKEFGYYRRGGAVSLSGAQIGKKVLADIFRTC